MALRGVYKKTGIVDNPVGGTLVQEDTKLLDLLIKIFYALYFSCKHYPHFCIFLYFADEIEINIFRESVVFVL